MTTTDAFFQTLAHLDSATKPDLTAVAFDTPQATFRHKLSAAYKANRSPKPEGFDVYLKGLQEALARSHRVPMFQAPGFEGDDVLGTLTNSIVEAGGRVRILTGDQDLFQLVDDERDVACLYLPARGWPGSPLLMRSMNVVNVLKVAPSRVIDLKALAGDSSDNISGVKGIGHVTAANLLHEYQSLDGIFDSLDMLPQSIKTKLENGRVAAYDSKVLARISTDVL